jgi:hypothetical protein
MFQQDTAAGYHKVVSATLTTIRQPTAARGELPPSGDARIVTESCLWFPAELLIAQQPSRRLTRPIP